MKQNPDYSVIYSDDDIVVFSKRSGLLIAADRYDADAPRLDVIAEKEFGRLYAVHRIDKDTSGLVIYARNPESHKALSLQFENRTVKIMALIMATVIALTGCGSSKGAETTILSSHSMMMCICLTIPNLN